MLFNGSDGTPGAFTTKIGTSFPLSGQGASGLSGGILTVSGGWGTGFTGVGGGGDYFAAGWCIAGGSGPSLNLTSLAGYNGSVQQFLGHDATGVLTWYTPTTCSGG